jgi:hypothetical protein
MSWLDGGPAPPPPQVVPAIHYEQRSKLLAAEKLRAAAGPGPPPGEVRVFDLI